MTNSRHEAVVAIDGRSCVVNLCTVVSQSLVTAKFEQQSLFLVKVLIKKNSSNKLKFNINKTLTINCDYFF
jgi:hypothetical protein